MGEKQRGRVLASAIVVALLGGGVATASVGGVQPSAGEGAPAAGSVATSVAKEVDGQIDDWTGVSPMAGGVSTMSAHEFVYQDFIYDDLGAGVGPRTANAGRGLGAKTWGTYRYPNDPARYGSNSSDLLEFRAALVGDQVHFLVRLNTLLAPDTTVVGIALGSADSPHVAWPLGARLATPADHVLTVWGTGGQLDATPLAEVGGQVAVDVTTNAIEVSVPASLIGTAFRTYVATGVWTGTGWANVDKLRSATEPAGGDGIAPNVFNVAFRHDETAMLEDQTWQDGNFWFDLHQSVALAAGNIDPYYADIDLDAPDAAPPALVGLHQLISTVQVTPAPHEGFLEQEGRGRGCSLATGPVPSCTTFSLVGPHQPYAVYVPPGGYDRMVVLLHGGTYPLNYTMVRRAQEQLGDETRSLLVEPVALGPASWYTDESHLAVLDAMRDAQSRFAIDASDTVIGGISMGGYGTNRLLVTNPDLFAGGILWSAAVGDVTHEFGGSSYETAYEPGQGNPVELLENNRDHRMLINHAIGDQSAVYAKVLVQTKRLDELGYDHEVHAHPTWQHTTVFSVNDWSREAAFIRSVQGDPNPAHVTFSTSEAWWRPDLSPDLVFDKAYWVSGLRVRDTSGGLRSKATVDAVTFGLGKAEPVTAPTPEAIFSGPPAPYVRSGRHLVPSQPLPGENRFVAGFVNVERVAVDLDRMGLSTSTDFAAEVTTDGPSTLRLLGAAPADVSGAPSHLEGNDVVVTLPTAGAYRLTVGNPPPPPDPVDPPGPPRGDAGLVTDCSVTADPGPGSFEIVPETGGGATNITSGDNRARLGSPGTRSYYVAEIGPDGAHLYGRRDGATGVGEPKRAESHEIAIGPDPWVCASSPAAGLGAQGP